MAAPLKLISILIPILNEEENIPYIFKEIHAIKKKLNERIELIFIDDGSTDNSWPLIQKLIKSQSYIKGIKFSKNFGHQKAFLAGLHHAKGDAVITMDADLEHPPSLIPKLINKWKEGFQIVETKRDYTKQSYFKRTSSFLFHHIFNGLSTNKIPENSSDFILFDRKIITEIMKRNDFEFFLRGFISSMGFKRCSIPYQIHLRQHGTTKFSFFKLVKFSARVLVSSSVAPLKFSIWIGFIMMGLTFFEILYVIHQNLYADPVEGWSSIILVMMACFSILFLILGILGIYISRIFMHIQKKPRYILEELEGFKK